MMEPWNVILIFISAIAFLNLSGAMKSGRRLVLIFSLKFLIVSF